MKNIIGLLALITVIFSSQVFATTPEDVKSLVKCTESWPNHPFGTITTDSKIRVIRGQVKVAGVGGETKDTIVTTKPELILVRPSVSVMSTANYELMNPNGWYCFTGKVTVMGASHIIAHCDAKLSSSEGVTVFGKGDPNSQGTTVMGSSSVKRVNCKK